MTPLVPVGLEDGRFVLGRLIWCGKDRKRGMIGGVLHHGQSLPVVYRDGAWHVVEPVLNSSGAFLIDELERLDQSTIGAGGGRTYRKAEGKTGRPPKARGAERGRPPKLTPKQQREARVHVAKGEPQHSVANRYNVSQSTISRLSAGRPPKLTPKQQRRTHP